MSDFDLLKDAIVKMNYISLIQTGRGPKVNEIVIPCHHYTCGKDSEHGDLFPLYEDGTVKLICPDCDYTHSFLIFYRKIKK